MSDIAPAPPPSIRRSRGKSPRTSHYVPPNTSRHREQISKACRALFVAEGTVEEALSVVLETARREFGWHVVVVHPAQMRIDGCPYQWPERSGNVVNDYKLLPPNNGHA